MIRKIPFKTIAGSLLLAAAHVPKLAPFAPILTTLGTALAGVGVADKLDKIRETIKDLKDGANGQTQS